ncbi:hypothetical protein AN958_09476 [Leucoagaricus sp. SymC.cos]|nr:hypothetical protein AN958_09476 [Leucoagaricus sp. SymC.cos]
MNSALQHILVVGGNGFIGSAVCKAATARGIQVTSVSSSGRPYRTAKGHTPAWINKVSDATLPPVLNLPEDHKDVQVHLLVASWLPFLQVSGVVHTLGTLFEDADGTYKRAIKSGDVPGLLSSFLENVVTGGSGGNPLEKHRAFRVQTKRGTYEVMNRDSALRVCEAFMASTPSSGAVENVPRPFVYISAEDVFRPVIPARYIKTKREAERSIEEMMANAPNYRGIYIRPSLVYHAHQRPLTTPAAVLFNLSATFHAKVPPTLPTPSGVLRSLGSLSDSGDLRAPSPFESVANALEIPPIHVDHVADAILVALDSRSSVRGAVGVKRMRELIGWSESGANSGSGGVDDEEVRVRTGL